VETAGIEPAPPRCKRGALPSEPRPQVVHADGWSRTTTARGRGFTGRRARPCSASASKKGVPKPDCPQPMPALPASARDSRIECVQSGRSPRAGKRSGAKGCRAAKRCDQPTGRPTGFEPVRRGSQPRMLPLHHSHHETGTTGFEPATTRSTTERSGRTELRPQKTVPASPAADAGFAGVGSRRTINCVKPGVPREQESEAVSRRDAARPAPSPGGIRTHGLELMRLARTASPLPRSLPGWNRTSGLRFPKPAGWPSPLQAEAKGSTPGGSRTRPSRLRAGRHNRSTTGA
jgi:hypothetical protein